MGLIKGDDSYVVIIVVKPEIAYSKVRAQINELLYLLQTDAQMDREIKRIIIERDAAIEEAYSFTYGITTWDQNEFNFIKDVPTLASEVIAIKERYEKRLRRCTVKHKRFKTIIDHLNIEEQETFLKTFCSDIEVDERDVKRIIKKHLVTINRYYPEKPTDEIEKLLDSGEQIQSTLQRL